MHMLRLSWGQKQENVPQFPAPGAAIRGSQGATDGTNGGSEPAGLLYNPVF
jgi:hypothetical protein